MVGVVGADGVANKVALRHPWRILHNVYRVTRVRNMMLVIICLHLNCYH